VSPVKLRTTEPRGFAMTHDAGLRTLAALLVFVAATAPTRALATPPPATESTAASPSPAPPAPPTPSPPPPSASLAPYIAGGLAVVAAGMGVAFGVLALDSKSDFEKSPTRSEASSGNDYAAYCDASFGAAVLAGATSVVLFLAQRDVHPDPVVAPAGAAKASVTTFVASPILVPHGAGAGLTVRF